MLVSYFELVSDFELFVPFMVVSFENEDPRFFLFYDSFCNSPGLHYFGTFQDYTTLHAALFNL
jgi:hypothetical protein